MNTAVVYQENQVYKEFKIAPPISLPIKAKRDHKLENLQSALSPSRSWGERKNAAQQLGYGRYDQAVPALLKALPNDPFWMVRCAIIQALEMIGDPAAIPVLDEVAGQDGFQVVRSHAAKAVERLAK
jgi:HEAT repeat protein